MDTLKRQQLLRKIGSVRAMESGGRHSPPPVVTLEDFFEGNDDRGSIGCNLLEDDNPGLDEFYRVLREVRDRPDVQDVLVEIDDDNAEDEDEDDENEDDADVCWPFSERVYVLASAAADEVGRWLESLHPDDVAEGPIWERPSQAFPRLHDGMKIYSALWD